MMQSQQIPMTFQRYETKYMLSPIMARKLRKSLPGHLQMDEYGLDTICSLYYDTPDPVSYTHLKPNIRLRAPMQKCRSDVF